MEWRQIPDKPRYWVSSTGLVRKAINARHPERPQWDVREGSQDGRGYFSVMVDRQRWLVHRLVYSMFVGPLVDGLVVCHRDGNPANNSVENLLQDTQKVNISHKLEHGTAQIGERHGRAKYSLETVQGVAQALVYAPKYDDGKLERGAAQIIADRFSVPVELVHQVKKGAWRYALRGGAISDAALKARIKQAGE